MNYDLFEDDEIEPNEPELPDSEAETEWDNKEYAWPEDTDPVTGKKEHGIF